MLKKLQNLLFEEPEEDEEYEDEEVVSAKPAKPAPQPKQAPARPVSAQQQPARPAKKQGMARIDLTQSFERPNYENTQNIPQQPNPNQPRQAYGQAPVQNGYPQQSAYSQQDPSYGQRQYAQPYQQPQQGYPPQSAPVYPQQPQVPNYGQPQQRYAQPQPPVNNGYNPAQRPMYQQPQNSYAQQEYARPQQAPESAYKPQQPPVYQRTEARVFGQEPTVPDKPTATNITFDQYRGRVQTPVEPPRQPAAPVQKKQTPVYEFQPVISPIFGVDEKDMSALKTAGTRSASSDSHVSEIISPIYGLNSDAQPSNIQTTVEKSNAVEQLTVTPAAVEAEDEIPDFSLDAILHSNEVEFPKESIQMKKESLFSEEIVKNPEADVEQTTVLDTEDFSFPSLRIDE